jgi:uncharacterized protein YifN (PemK superfamily)
MKDNTQITHTKFQKCTTSPTGVIAKRKKNGKKFFFGPLTTFHFSHSIKLDKTLRLSENPSKKDLMFVLFLKETRHL